MTPTNLCRLLTALLVFFAAVLTTIVASAQSPTRTANWVNIKDPKFGAIGNGIHDDTAAIQAAIDYAFANNLTAVYCPVWHIQDQRYDMARPARKHARRPVGGNRLHQRHEL